MRSTYSDFPSPARAEALAARPERRPRRLTMARLETDLVARLVQRAARSGRHRSDIIAEALRRYLDSEEGQRPSG